MTQFDTKKTEFVSRESINDTLEILDADATLTFEGGYIERRMHTFRPNPADLPGMAKALLPKSNVTQLSDVFYAELNQLDPAELLAAAHAVLARLIPEPIDPRDELSLVLFAGYHGLVGVGAAGTKRWASWHHVPVHLLGGVDVVEVRAQWRRVAMNAVVPL